MQRGAVQGEPGRYRRLGGVTASFIRRSQEVHAVLADRLLSECFLPPTRQAGPHPETQHLHTPVVFLPRCLCGSLRAAGGARGGMGLRCDEAKAACHVR